MVADRSADQLSKVAMATISELAKLSGDALKSILTPIGAGFGLECVRYGEFEAMHVEITLPSVQVSGFIPDGANDGSIGGLFSLMESVDGTSLAAMAQLCTELQEAGFSWDISAENLRPYVSLSAERQRGENEHGYVFAFWVSLLHEVLMVAPCFRALKMGSPPSFAAKLAVRS